jgi:60 kDa SS-A/Ro ribonucleoprotein
VAKTYSSFSTLSTPQSEPIPESSQVANSAGGFSFAVDDWERLDRFLNLGTEGGSYHAGEQALTKDNALAVMRCIKADAGRVLDTLVSVSFSGRAPKNDPALFVLAMLFAHAPNDVKARASKELPVVARIGTHLLHFVPYAEQFRGWGRVLKRAVADYYLNRDESDLAYDAVKFQSRDKWSQADVLRLAHPKVADSNSTRNAIFKWIVDGWESIGDDVPEDEPLKIIWAYERAKRATAADEIVALIKTFQLPREAIPTQFLSDKPVWEALLLSGGRNGMPMTAMIRNLATMTRLGLFDTLNANVAHVMERLADEEAIRSARVHPIQVLSALKTYQQGHGERGHNTWTPNARIVDALDKAFYLSFGNVRPTNKRIMLALDVSGSMAGNPIAGVPGLTARDGAAAMALVTAAVEPNYTIMAFAHDFRPLSISPRQRLDDVVKATSGLSFGGTDCALPMRWALRNKAEIDAFIVYTDSETWFGDIHPVQALNAYRKVMGIPAKLVVVGMVANKFSIADPNDAGMMDVVGFDTAAPNVISDFIAR